MISLGTVMTAVSACEAPMDVDPEREGSTESEIAQTEAETETAAASTTAPTAAEVMAKLATCRKISRTPYAKDQGGSANINICDLSNAVFFTGDMDIDCDGKTTSVCNRSTDASYQSSTAAVDSRGKALDASTLPYIVVPGVSSRWSYRTSGIKMGSVAAVIYNGKIEYGVVGDVGPQAIVGEASYAMAKKLGINPNPSTGGVSSGVTYVVFKGAGPSRIEDRDATTKLGIERAKKLIADN
ncbi:MAG: glycoside hydrolase family 75 protein [Labilithrix sp.]